MSYRLFTDKINKFQCDLQVEGTSLTKSQARIIVETNEMSYLFKGKIYDTGVCEFELPKLKNILPEGSVGMLKLEVIADDIHFEPWSSDYIVEADKKVIVSIQEQERVDNSPKKPNIVMSQITLTEAKVPEVKEPKIEIVVVEDTKPRKKVAKEVKKAQPIKENKIIEPTIITKKDVMEFIKNRK